MRAIDIKIGEEYMYNSTDRIYEERRVKVLESPVTSSRTKRADSARVLFLDADSGEPQMVTRWGSDEPVERISLVPLRTIKKLWADHLPVIEERREAAVARAAEKVRLEAVADRLNKVLGLEPEEDRRRYAGSLANGVFHSITRHTGASFSLELSEEQALALMARLENS